MRAKDTYKKKMKAIVSDRSKFESLFTNVYLEDTIDKIINDLFLITDKVHDFEREELKQLLTFASYESFFIFDGEYCPQIDGDAMGSLLGPKFANEFLPNVYKRYVDDIFVTFNSYSQLLKFVDFMNYQHPNIKFTFEVEKNNNFSFLDAKICRENNKFTTSVFRKPTFSAVFTNFDCFIPISYKHSLVNTLIFQCSKICSSYEKLHNEIFKRNRYPNDFVD